MKEKTIFAHFWLKIQKQGPGCPEWKPWEALEFSQLTTGPQLWGRLMNLDISSPGNSPVSIDDKCCERC